MTRQILGVEFSDVTLTQQHLERAKHRLETEFHLVLTIEDLNTKGQALISELLGWRTFERRGTLREAELEPKDSFFLPQVQMRNKLDLQLYKHAKRLQEISVERMRGMNITALY